MVSSEMVIVNREGSLALSLGLALNPLPNFRYFTDIHRRVQKKPPKRRKTSPCFSLSHRSPKPTEEIKGGSTFGFRRAKSKT